ncbi:UbiA prenyltransferase family-domain-containing protein [Coniella lustricola]|uniref:UbiA prenyltransferase family-domain-containing protein n=1 Tax=Coniella lustricola TaxID=2025994 RepID=A0A2T3A658_9PEZI|nr:UbiA prenyltransferase family-domain-containing protein [Coniella lustricola]
MVSSTVQPAKTGGQSQGKGKVATSDYQPPTTGVLSKLPASWVPYAELIRLEQPHGLYMTYFPHILGLMYACSAKPTAVAPSVLAHRLAVFFVWTFFLRSSGCAWNDITDQEFDRHTARCRNRPVARGAVTATQGYIYAFLITALGFLTLYTTLPFECTLCGLATTILAMIYPFGKRFTYFPQVILGACQASTIVTASYSVGLPAFSAHYFIPTLCLTTTVLLLIIFYDTIYARQDIVDDLKSGVKGMAVLFRNHIEALLGGLTCSITFLLATAGSLLNMGPYFFAFSVVGLASGLVVMIALIRWHVLPGFEKYSGWFYAAAIVNLLGGCVAEYASKVFML